MLVDDIASAFESENDIALPQIEAWMLAEDTEGRAALYAYLRKPGNEAKVRPEIPGKVLQRFFFSYLQECILSNTVSEWAHSRYEACWDLAGLVKAWARHAPTLPIVGEVKAWIEWAYMSRQELRTALVTGFLEHVFEERSAREQFADWKKHPTLASAYAQAMNWVETGGPSRTVR